MILLSGNKTEQTNADEKDIRFKKKKIKHGQGESTRAVFGEPKIRELD